MPKTTTHNAIILRPPPGTRFSIYNSDVELQFERGREVEIHEWLSAWLETYVFPELQAAHRAQVEAPQPSGPNHEISLLQQKLAALSMKAIPAAVPHVTPPVATVEELINTHPNLKPGKVVYGPNGPMSEQEIASLPDRPIPGVGYVSPDGK